MKKQSASRKTLLESLFAVVNATLATIQTAVETIEGLASGASGFVQTKLGVDSVKNDTSSLLTELALLAAQVIQGGAPLQGTNEQTTGTGSVYSGYTTLLTLTKNSLRSAYTFSLRNNGIATKAIIQLSVGTAGNEVPIYSAKIMLEVGDSITWSVPIEQFIAAGTRISVHSYVESVTGGTLGIGWFVGQVA